MIYGDNNMDGSRNYWVQMIFVVLKYMELLPLACVELSLCR